MKNRHAIHVRNTIAAFWAGFSIPFACMGLLAEDRYHWIDHHPVLAITALFVFFCPLVFIAFLEWRRRIPKSHG
jgi:hypothetical protein